MHRVQGSSGEGFGATVDHQEKAVQYDFYIPAKIWRVPVVKHFLEALSALEGATISEGETGTWQGQQEKTNVFRLLVRLHNRTLARLEETLAEAIGALMAALSASEKHAQQAMMYTRTAITLVTLKNVKRVDD